MALRPNNFSPLFKTCFVPNKNIHILCHRPTVLLAVAKSIYAYAHILQIQEKLLANWEIICLLIFALKLVNCMYFYGEIDAKLQKPSLDGDKARAKSFNFRVLLNMLPKLWIMSYNWFLFIFWVHLNSAMMLLCLSMKKFYSVIIKSGPKILPKHHLVLLQDGPSCQFLS